MDNKDISTQAYLHTREAAAFVPFLQSLLTGFLLALLAFLGMLKLRMYLLDALFWAVVVWVVVLTGVWLLLQRHWFTLTNLEKLTGVDMNRDGVVGAEPARQSEHTVKVNIQETVGNGHIRITTARFAVPEWKMVELAQGLLAEKPFSEKPWTGDKGIFSINEFRAVRDEMLLRHLIKQSSTKSKKQGFELTPSGWAVMRDFASSSPTPLKNNQES